MNATLLTGVDVELLGALTDERRLTLLVRLAVAPLGLTVGELASEVAVMYRLSPAT